MNRYALFTDVSVNPQLKVGVGGYLLVPVTFLQIDLHDIERGAVSAQLRIKRFAETSSTKLEVQTVLWALEDSRVKLAGSAPDKLQIYTDSQCLAGLMGRRSVLENNDFIAKGSGRPLTNAPLYREFYAAYDQLGFQLLKIPGHSRAGSHDTVRRIFSYVDRDVRKALKLWMESDPE